MKSKNAYSEKTWQLIKYEKISVYYLLELDGGGMDFERDYINVIREHFGKVTYICEIAAGPGFIGFSLLAHSLCDKLCLIDINPLAIEACKKTILFNGLQDKVTVYESNCLDNIPIEESWDLVVSNPPHFDGKFSRHIKDLLLIDPGWDFHKKFYSDIHNHLNNGSNVLFVENAQGSDAKTFKPMIKSGGLEHVKSFQVNKYILETIIKNIKIILGTVRKNSLKNLFSIPKRVCIKPVQMLLIAMNPLYFIWSRYRK